MSALTTETHTIHDDNGEYLELHAEQGARTLAASVSGGESVQLDLKAIERLTGWLNLQRARIERA